MQVDFTLLMPEFMLAGLGVLVLTADFAVPWRSRGGKNGALAALTVLGLAVTFAVMLRMQWNTDPEILYDHLIYVDRYALLFKALAMGIGAVVVLISMEYVHTRIRHVGEFYALLVFAVLGASLMAGAAELLTAYIAIELLAFCLYVLVALSRGDARSGEAAVKYILLGAISSAVMLFGIALIYGAVGETGFRRGNGSWSRCSARRWRWDSVCSWPDWASIVDGALPSLGPGRLRRRAHTGNGAGLRALQGGGVRAHVALPR